MSRLPCRQPELDTTYIWCRQCSQCISEVTGPDPQTVLAWGRGACQYSPGSSRQATECWTDAHPAGLSAARWPSAARPPPLHRCLAPQHCGPCRDSTSVSCCAAKAGRQAAFRFTTNPPAACSVQGCDREPRRWAACYPWSGGARVLSLEWGSQGEPGCLDVWPHNSDVQSSEHSQHQTSQLAPLVLENTLAPAAAGS